MNKPIYRGVALDDHSLVQSNEIYRIKVEGVEHIYLWCGESHYEYQCGDMSAWVEIDPKTLKEIKEVI